MCIPFTSLNPPWHVPRSQKGTLRLRKQRCLPCSRARSQPQVSSSPRLSLLFAALCAEARDHLGPASHFISRDGDLCRAVPLVSLAPCCLILSTNINNVLYVKPGAAAGVSEVNKARLAQGLQPRAETGIKPATVTASPGSGYDLDLCSK